jgi:hypothetical protein
MKPIIIYAVGVLMALVFEWGYRLYSRKHRAPASKSQWCCFLWTSALLLSAICLMKPYDARTFVDWTPMFLLAFFHVQQCLQVEALERNNGKNKSGGTTP